MPYQSVPVFTNMAPVLGVIVTPLTTTVSPEAIENSFTTNTQPVILPVTDKVQLLSGLVPAP